MVLTCQKDVICDSGRNECEERSMGLVEISYLRKVEVFNEEQYDVVAFSSRADSEGLSYTRPPDTDHPPPLSDALFIESY